MPYYLHSKQSEPEHGTPYATAAAAHLDADPALQKITFIPTDDEKETWREREFDRFQSHQYIRVPWHSDDRFPDHYVHLSLSHVGLIAYTKNDEHGVSDRQTRVRAGKYLEEFYPDVAADTRATWIGKCAANHLELKIARTPDDIAKVYVGGPTSCMDGRHFDDSDRDHPCRVYGDSDLGVAYVGDISSVRARSVVWPDHMTHSRIYGDDHLLRSLLESAGYSNGSLRGAKIRRILGSDGYVAPYVDGIDFARDNGTWLILGSGAINVQQTNGIGVEEDESYTCDNCGESFHENESDSTEWCQSCYDDSYSCIDCDGTYFSDGTSVDAGMLCESCYSNRLKTCAVCDREWLEEEEFSRTERRDRNNNGTTDLCRRCQDDYAYCDECDSWYRNTSDDCLDCHPEEEEETDSDSDPIVPAVTPAVPPAIRYLRNSRIEFDGTTAYLMLDDLRVLYYVTKDGFTSKAGGNWTYDWQSFVESGAWEWFDPLPCQDPGSNDCIYPIRAHLPGAPITAYVATVATIGGGL